MTLMSLPYIKLWIKDHKKSISILQGGSPVAESFQYLLSSEQARDMQLVLTNRLLKWQEVSPDWVQRQTSQGTSSKYFSALLSNKHLQLSIHSSLTHGIIYLNVQ